MHQNQSWRFLPTGSPLKKGRPLSPAVANSHSKGGARPPFGLLKGIQGTKIEGLRKRNLPCGGKPIRTISGGFGINWQIRIRISSSRELCFLNDSNFWCSKFNHTQWPYMCMCCGLFAPTQFHSECCGVRDDS